MTWASIIWTLVALRLLAMGVSARRGLVGVPRETGRHDGSGWMPEDVDRAAQGGEPMPCAVCMLRCNGDWMEAVTTLGFPSWKDGTHSCYSCNAVGPMMYELIGAGPLGLPCRCNEEQDYEEACRRCEIDVILSGTSHSLLCSHLKYDKKKDGSQGLALSWDIPSVGLLAGDRVEPCAFLNDVGDFFQLTIFPWPMLFWRPSEQTITKHRNPLFNNSIGINPYRCMTTDVLHMLYLGIFKKWCEHVLWMLLLSGLWSAVGTMEEVINTSLISMNNQLSQWYKQRHRQYPTEKITRIKHMSHGRIGSNTERACKTKAAETWGLMLFLLDVIEGNLPRLPDWAPRFARAGRHLERMIIIFRDAGVHMTTSEIQECWDCYKQYLSLTNEDDDLQKIPKRHQTLHMLERLPDLGNPKGYANWVDETLNRTLKGTLKDVSQVTFEPALIVRMRELLKRIHAKHG